MRGGGSVITETARGFEKLARRGEFWLIDFTLQAICANTNSCASLALPSAHEGGRFNPRGSSAQPHTLPEVHNGPAFQPLSRDLIEAAGALHELPAGSEIPVLRDPDSPTSHVRRSAVVIPQ